LVCERSLRLGVAGPGADDMLIGRTAPSLELHDVSGPLDRVAGTTGVRAISVDQPPM